MPPERSRHYWDLHYDGVQQMIFETVVDVMSENTGTPSESIKLDSVLKDIGIDSLKSISILFELEDRLEIEIPINSIETIDTVGDIVRFLESLEIAGTTHV